MTSTQPTNQPYAGLRKYSPFFIVLASIGGFIGDVLQPLGPLLLYSTILSLAAALVLTIFIRRLPMKARLLGGFLWIWFACSGIFVLGQFFLGAGSTGLVADVIPGVASLQSQMGLVQERLDEVHAQTTRIDETTARIEDSVNVLGDGIRELGQLGGIIQDPQTPEQWYGNAKLHELKGDFGNARRAYLQCLPRMPDKIDAHLAFMQFLKAQEGRVGAREVYLPIARRNPGVGTAVAMALLLPPAQHAEALEQITVDDELPAPVLYLLADRYSAERLGAQSLADKREELEWLELFVKASEQQPYLRYFANQSMAASWVDTAASRLAALEASTSIDTLANPVELNVMPFGRQTSVNVSIAEPATLIEFRTDPSAEFRSTGLLDYLNPDTGKKLPNPQISLPLEAGDVFLEIRYTNAVGDVLGPFDMTFNGMDEARLFSKDMLERMPQATWIEWSRYPNEDGTTNVHLQLITYRLAIKSARYSINDSNEWVEIVVIEENDLHQVIYTGEYTGDRKIMVPYEGTRSIQMQIEYYDGELSQIQEFQAPPH